MIKPQLNECVITITVIEEHDKVKYTSSRVYRMDLAMTSESDVNDFIRHIHQSVFVQHTERLIADKKGGRF